MGKILFFGLLLICIFLGFFFYKQKENNIIYNKIVEKFDDNVFVDETYTYLFKDSNLKELVFIKSQLIIPELEHKEMMKSTGYRADAYKALSTVYRFDFKVHDNKILGFKSVIFEGFEDAKVSKHENNLPSEKWQQLK
ncbi:virulence-associated protein BptA, partial [Borreliella burgdorferi 297]